MGWHHVQGIALDDRNGSGWLSHAAQHGGNVSQQGSLAQALSTHGSLSQPLSAQGSLAQNLSPAGSLQAQLPAQQLAVGALPPHGGAQRVGPSRLGVGSPPGSAAAFAAANPAMANAPSSADNATSASSGSLSNASTPGAHGLRLAQRRCMTRTIS